jgi:hypothetical protein
MHTVPRNRSSPFRRGPRLPITIRPTQTDVTIARAIARDTGPAPQEVARALTWGADEKVLLVLAALGWLASRGRNESLRRAGNHALLVAGAASLLPHGMKLLFDQTRPDRKTVLGHVHGVSFSGNREDAFPPPRAAHGCAGLRGRSIAGRTPPGDPRCCDRTLADPSRGPGALGERRHSRICARSHRRAGATPVDRLSAQSSAGG